MSGGTALLQYTGGAIGGQLQVNGGTLTLDSINTTTVSGGVLIGSGGTLEVAGGTLTANVTNNGILSLGRRSSPYAGDLFTIAGNYTQTAAGKLVMDVGPSNNDRLTVTGQAALAGKFELLPVSGYTPGPYTSFTLLDYGSRFGTFDELLLPTLPMGTWQALYGGDLFTPGSFTLQINP